MRKRLRPHHDERGIALVTVIGVGFTLLIATSIIATQALTNIRQVSKERQSELGIQLADAGLDTTIFKLSQNASYATGETVPGSFTSVAAEKSWAISAATAADASRVITGPDGEYVAIRPANKPLIYSVAFIPTRANPTSTRVVRAAYDAATEPLGYAVLAGGGLSLPNHTDIKYGNVHSNGNLTGSGKGKVDGSITSSGSYYVDSDIKVGNSAGSGGGYPLLSMPDINPRNYYGLSQYDLCPGGIVKPGPAFPGTPQNTSGTPCSGSVAALADLSAANGATYRGWTYTGTTASGGAIWDYPGKKTYDGVYYVYQGSAVVSGGPKKWTASVFAEAAGTASGGTCNQVGGDISITGKKKWDKMSFYPTAQPFLFAAGRDFLRPDPAHNHKFSGVISAREQFLIGTKHLELFGSLIATNICDTPGTYGALGANWSVLGHFHGKYTRYTELPVNSLAITQWEEL